MKVTFTEEALQDMERLGINVDDVIRDIKERLTPQYEPSDEGNKKKLKED